MNIVQELYEKFNVSQKKCVSHQLDFKLVSSFLKDNQVLNWKEVD